MASALSSARLLLPSPAPVSTSGAALVQKARRAKRIVVSCCQSCSCGEAEQASEKWVVSRRGVVVGAAISSVVMSALPALALLEADDDEFLLERVKEDRRKRIEKRGTVISFGKETESVQKAVYELSKAGQAIDGEDFGLANSVLGTTDVAWIQDVKEAFSKVNKNQDEEIEAKNFGSAIRALQSAVSKKDSELSKTAFVASASALEKWSSLTGLSDQIKGL